MLFTLNVHKSCDTYLELISYLADITKGLPRGTRNSYIHFVGIMHKSFDVKTDGGYTYHCHLGFELNLW